MSKDLQEQFVLSAPIASLEDLPAALKDAPIDRPALLEHLGKSRFIIGKVSKISHLTPAQVTAVQEQPYFKDFKGYSFIKTWRLLFLIIPSHCTNVIGLQQLFWILQTMKLSPRFLRKKRTLLPNRLPLHMQLFPVNQLIAVNKYHEPIFKRDI